MSNYIITFPDGSQEALTETKPDEILEVRVEDGHLNIYIKYTSALVVVDDPVILAASFPPGEWKNILSTSLA